MPHVLNLFLFTGEIVLYFVVMTALFRMRHAFGIGIFYTALGTMHFLETYLASILYIEFPLGIAVSPGSSVLFAGKLAMLLLVYIREDAAAVRQPIYGLLLGNFLMVGLVMLLHFHIVSPTVPDRMPDMGFLDQMGWLMVWGTVLLFCDSILIVLLYERTGSWMKSQALRVLVSAAAVLTFDQLGFYAALRMFLGVPWEALYGGWIAKMGAAVAYALLTAAYLKWAEQPRAGRRERPKLADLFDTLTYRQRYEALLRQSGRDSLTGLLNRGRFDRDAMQAVREGVAANRPVSLLILDLDHFKAVNDEHGHAVGDEVLRLIAGEIGNGARAGDSIYRYGGEEFAVIADGLSHAQALVAAERLRLRIAGTPVPALNRPMTASIGVATTPDDGTDLTQLFGVADSRLYGAKESGRNRILGRLAQGRPETPRDWREKREPA